MLKSIVSALLVGVAANAAAVGLSTCYVSVEGSGTRDGSSAANAMSGNVERGIQRAWDATAPGGTVLVAPGLYKDQSLSVKESNAGAAGQIKKLVGVKGPDGGPVFVADWDKNKPDQGRSFVTLDWGASNLEFRNLVVKTYKNAFYSKGDNSNLTFANLQVNEARNGIYLNGSRKGSNNILITDCTFTYFSKRGVRFQDGVRHAKVVNCVADAGGKAYATEKFQICFGAGNKGVNGVDEDILFENCVAMNAYDDAGPKYWNADGFCAESNTRRIVWKNCKAFDCTDGGWDIKTAGAELINCVAFRNKRNFRCWSAGGAKFINCIGGYAKMQGGTGTEVGLHVCGKAKVVAENCTFVGNDIQIDADQNATLTIKNSILASIGKQKTKTEDRLVEVAIVDCVVSQGDGAVDPGFKNPTSDWSGEGDNFNTPLGPAKGYHWTANNN